MTMKGTYNDSEEIKLEVTMFDGCESVPKLGDDSSGEDVRLHISVLVDISKRSGDDALEFVCSAWRDCLEIHKLYLFSPNSMASGPYLGPHFRCGLCFLFPLFRYFASLALVVILLTGLWLEYLLF